MWRLDPFYAPFAPAFLGLAQYMLKKYAGAVVPLRELLRGRPFPARSATHARLGHGKKSSRSTTHSPHLQSMARHGASCISKMQGTPHTSSLAFARRDCRKLSNPSVS